MISTNARCIPGRPDYSVLASDVIVCQPKKADLHLPAVTREAEIGRYYNVFIKPRPAFGCASGSPD